MEKKPSFTLLDRSELDINIKLKISKAQQKYQYKGSQQSISQSQLIQANRLVQEREIFHFIIGYLFYDRIIETLESRNIKLQKLWIKHYYQAFQIFVNNQKQLAGVEKFIPHFNSLKMMFFHFFQQITDSQMPAFIKQCYLHCQPNYLLKIIKITKIKEQIIFDSQRLDDANFIIYWIKLSQKQLLFFKKVEKNVQSSSDEKTQTSQCERSTSLIKQIKKKKIVQTTKQNQLPQSKSKAKLIFFALLFMIVLLVWIFPAKSFHIFAFLTSYLFKILPFCIALLFIAWGAYQVLDFYKKFLLQSTKWSGHCRQQ